MARCYFPARRFGHVTSNISESMNLWLEEARHFNPVELFTAYIRKLNILFERRCNKYSPMNQTQLLNKVSRMFNISVEDSRTLRVYRHTNTIFEVESKNDPRFLRVVNLSAMECSCGFYKEHGVPCRHICAAALFIQENPDRFIIKERLLRALKATYAGSTEPVDLRLLHDDGLKPPEATKRRGRPKESRIPFSVENCQKKTVTCRRCGAPGHNSRSCKAKTK